MNSSAKGLDLIQIAAPCPVPWDSMIGSERVRFCCQCQLYVYNLSEMDRAEAEQIVQQQEGRTCVQFFRREDGTILTKDCPVGLRMLKGRFVRALLATASLFLAMLSATVLGKAYERRFGFSLTTPLERLARWADPRPPAVGGMMFCPPGAFQPARPTPMKPRTS